MDTSLTKRILVIDDEPDVREILSYNFSKKGFKVFAEPDGLSGLLSLKTTKPDLIILDIMMPFMDGLSMSRELKKNPVFYKIPVIFLGAATSNTNYKY
ncbi:MAG: response regulator [Bacteroidetes bacterium]|nr:response regulator [Bacteroidota bacterium]